MDTWKSLIAELGAAGLSQARIAKECNCAQATISDLACGATKEPRYQLGCSLKALHAREMRKPRPISGAPTQPSQPHESAQAARVASTEF